MVHSGTQSPTQAFTTRRDNQLDRGLGLSSDASDDQQSATWRNTAC
ncbi:unnamed protein product [Anisakis simplex]|uniref:Uncharacterized protein n=1 Tax=Anisakis simplex TaxID=6269 RepID=A0A3P6Q272_ANISI|nr:unnamed protein product [Anisakis simplex]